VTFKDGYSPRPGEEPYISFCNGIGEFQIVFLNEKHIKLQSSSILETHDDAGRFETDLKCCEYEGFVRHWIFFGSYLVIYSHDCYGTFRSPTKSIYICDAPVDKLWVQSFRERECDTYVKIILQSVPTVKKHPTSPKSRVRDFFRIQTLRLVLHKASIGGQKFYAVTIQMLNRKHTAAVK
jgi:hypothetical protein